MKTAKTAAQKNQRAEKILTTAAELFDHNDYSQITMSDIAQHCDLSKGTIFNYYPTKEALFLSLLNTKFSQYISVFSTTFNATADMSTDEFKKIIIDSVCSLFDTKRFLTYLRLMAIRTTVLNPGADAKTLKLVNSNLSQSSTDLAVNISQHLPGVVPQQLANLFSAINALVLGFFINTDLSSNFIFPESKLPLIRQTVTDYLDGFFNNSLNQK
ncbi:MULTISPECIES: TetR/AcrR family transcriptional regulator [Furfurilactobacillus]|uniref:TetR family transcriptional regulator n=1 Tax=Furfurilactobacillus rossiae TaxID=231049 RepID=A0A7C9JHG5_9LACO|nr:TetR/AcrR family transcriptional regulator [Furfurilactobacillus milii]MYV05933.1 TetR family transcriptional regulator [Furfurilactobacillus milii]